MPRLYAWLSSDMKTDDLACGGNERIHVTIHYGNKVVSRDLLNLTVTYTKGTEKPTVQFDVAPDIKVITNREP